MHRKAFTLLEVLIALLILAVVGAALGRQLTSTDNDARLDLAASEIAGALRFARAEAVRTGAIHGVRVGASDQRVRVYRLDTSSPPFLEIFDVRHPVDKKPYDLDLETAPFAAGVSIEDVDFRFGGSATVRESVSFAASGTPVSPTDLALLDSGSVDLLLDELTRRVTVAPMTGRVTVE